LFMHRNPVERHLSHGQGFIPDGLPGAIPSPTGTDDLLLYHDIGLALVRACFQEVRVPDSQDKTTSRVEKTLLDDPDQLIFRLRQEQDEQGFSIFDALGNRSGRGGEYLTLLRPLYDGLRLLPQSRIDVYNRDPATQQWKKL